MRKMIERLGHQRTPSLPLVGLSRDSYRHPPTTDAATADVERAIVEIAHARRRFGYRRIHDLLRRECHG